MKRNIAREGVFTKPDLTPMKSIERANLHDILYYLNLQAIEAKENEQQS
jgi:hypothetical protein